MSHIHAGAGSDACSGNKAPHTRVKSGGGGTCIEDDVALLGGQWVAVIQNKKSLVFVDREHGLGLRVSGSGGG